MFSSQSEDGDLCWSVHLVDTVLASPYVETLLLCCCEVISQDGPYFIEGGWTALACKTVICSVVE